MTPQPATQLKQGLNDIPIRNKDRMPKPPLNIRRIRSLAGDVWFARGEAYFKAGRVFELNVHNSKLSARVTGPRTISYFFSWTCPLGVHKAITKHQKPGSVTEVKKAAPSAQHCGRV